MSGFGVTPLTPMPSVISIPLYHYILPHLTPHFESKVIKYGGAKQLITPPITSHSCSLCQDLILTTITPGNTKPQTGGALTTKPQCRQTTSA